MTTDDGSDPVARAVAALAMTPVPPPTDANPDGLPHVTHEGRLAVGAAVLRVYLLSDGRRVIDGGDLVEFFRLAEGG